MSPSNPSLGFIGLGVMGSRMAVNLANKMPESPFYIFDISQESMHEIQAKVSRTKLCQSSREVAEKAVCTSNLSYLTVLSDTINDED
jgi:3-hydroxyisobutyrate dehydrogenase-like beta-hydroxyacid dehydrogenase